ncbi:MAG: UDP-N-acetylmuramoylalanine--D-glutamate ligase [Bacteroidia bacterium]|nr:UDP-N-acetylmuramoylalanine--D-glutamate ligase [Bacteroidia bacterium]
MDESFDLTSARGIKLPFIEDDQDIMEIRKDIIRESLADIYDKTANFETIATIKGVDYVNDAHALRVESTGSSLLRCYKPVVWIVAQPHNSGELAEISEIVEEKVSAIICLGENVNDVFKAFGTNKTQLFLNAENTVEAVNVAASITRPGEMVLFSPASENVEKNAGKEFNRAVRALKKQ